MKIILFLPIFTVLVFILSFLPHAAYADYQQINPGMSLNFTGSSTISNGIYNNGGTINNYGTTTISGLGMIDNNMFGHGGTINNYGTIIISQGNTISNEYQGSISGIINNYGTITIYGSMANAGIINNICTGTINGPQSVQNIVTGTVHTIGCLSTSITFVPNTPAVSTPVTLNAVISGGASPFSYSWSLTPPTGSAITLSNPNSSSPTFTPDVVGVYQVSLTVKDSTAQTSTTTSSITSVIQNGSFVLPCSMQEKGDGVSTSSCSGMYVNGMAQAQVKIVYNTGLFPFKNYQAVGFFIDNSGNQLPNIQVVLDQINPGQSKFLNFTNSLSGAVSQFKMQLLGGTLVTSTDTTPPTIIPPTNQIVTATSPSGAIVNYPQATATDNVGVTSGPTCTPPSGSTFPIGTTTVTCTASDAAGNVGKATFTVTVQPPQQSSPTITTDKQSYSVGNTVVISGTNFPANANLILAILNPSPNVNSTALSITSTNQGQFSTTWTIPSTFGTGTYTIQLLSQPSVSTKIQVSANTISSTITVSTDKSSYNYGDTITISGKSSTYISNTLVTVVIRDQLGNAIKLDQIPLGSDKTFSTTVTASGSLWQGNKPYSVYVQLGSPAISSSTTFSLNPVNGQLPTPTQTQSNSYAQATSQDGSTIITVTTGPLTNGQPFSIALTFKGSASLIPILHQNYAISITQDGNLILANTTAHTHTGFDIQTTTNLSSADPVNIRLMLNGVGLPGTDPSTWTGPKGDVLNFLNMGGGSTIQHLPQQTPQLQSGTINVAMSSGAGADQSCVSAQNCFSPSVVQITTGSTVTWTNNDKVGHTATSGHSSDNVSGTVFDSSLVAAGKTYSFTFQNTGIYYYFCQVHPWMIGEIAVGQSAQPLYATTPTPTPTPQPTPSPPISQPTSTNLVIMTTGAGADQSCVAAKNCFSPSFIQVPVGTTVTWQNNDKVGHTATSGEPSDSVTGTVWDSSLVSAGKTYSFTFQNAGDYHYFCQVHPWMTGEIIVGQGGQPLPTPVPTPTGITVSTDKSSYYTGDTITASVVLSGSSSGQNIAVSIVDPTGSTVVSRTVTTDNSGSASLQFKLPLFAKAGTYQVVATTSVNGKSFNTSAQFSVQQKAPSISIVSVQATDQQGNPVSSFSRGSSGYVKVLLYSQSNTPSLVTVNLFDSDLTALGIGSIQTTLSTGQSAIILSFPIPSDAAVGSASIYVDTFSDWPTSGGKPLTPESSSTVGVQ